MLFEGNFSFSFFLNEWYYSILHANGNDPVERGETDDAGKRGYLQEQSP